MSIRKKPSRSGTVSIVIVSKAHGKFIEVKKFGVAKSAEEADGLYLKDQTWLRTHDGQQEFGFEERRGKEQEETARVVDNMDSILINGTQLLLLRTDG